MDTPQRVVRGPILLEDGWADIKNYLDMVIQGSDFDCKMVHATYSKVYNMAVQRPPHNYCEELYNEMINHQNNLIDTLVVKHKEHFDERGLDVTHKDYVLWKHSQYIITWYKKVFLYLDQYYTKREQLPSIPDTLQQCWIDKGISTYTSEQEIVYLNEWKGLIRVKQKLQLALCLAKCQDFPFPEDLYDIIIPHLSSNPVTDKYAFKTLHIQLEYNTSPITKYTGSQINYFGLMD